MRPTPARALHALPSIEGLISFQNFEGRRPGAPDVPLAGYVQGTEPDQTLDGGFTMLHAHAHDDSNEELDSSPSDDFDRHDLLRAVLGAVDDDRSKPSDIQDLGGLGSDSDSRVLRGTRGRSPHPGVRRRSDDELIAQSQRIRKECNELVGRYDAAVRATHGDERTTSLGESPTPHRKQSSDVAWRKKALLLMLIEELM